MAQINGAAVTFLLLLTVSLFCQDTVAWACCRRYSKGQLPISLIRGYTIQTIHTNCNINAIIFHTYGGRKVCVNPYQSWVKNSIQKLMTRVQSLKKQEKEH